MAQFDVYEYAGPNRSVAYLLDVQSDLLRDLASRVVIPLVRLNEFGLPMKKLNPVFSIDGVDHVMATSEIAGMLTKNLGRRVGNLEVHHHEIKGAVDFLVDGY
ncbi:CcdB family protein [Telmatospirillum sp.]|uniref:CcdB family protein n=1 Tax=Telmatospirillum sp. TaxID=2079197 RepID=UPI002846CB37|nr:CcdB family protein [Telmatospirillum sp.]MDR3440369.1 CcdB family protein [Telmatospirillum sp.]